MKTRHPRFVLISPAILGLLLAACGGGGGGGAGGGVEATVVPISQQEATDVVDSVNTGNIIVNDEMVIATRLGSLLISLNGDTLRKVATPCPGGGTYLVSADDKMSRGGAILAGESATVTLDSCRTVGSKTSLTGTASVKATQSGNGMYDFVVSAQGFKISYDASQATFEDTVSGTFGLQLRAGAPLTYTVHSSEPVTATVANYPKDTFIRNGNFTLSEVNNVNEVFEDGYSVNVAFRTDFVGTDSATYSAKLETVHPTRYTSGDTFKVTTPGTFQIRGYKNTQIQLTVDSTISAIADVDFGADGTSDLNFNLFGAYLY